MKIRYQRNWRSKPHPYWFFRRNVLSRGGTFQSGPLNVWW